MFVFQQLFTFLKVCCSIRIEQLPVSTTRHVLKLFLCEKSQKMLTTQQLLKNWEKIGTDMESLEMVELFDVSMTESKTVPFAW